MPWFGAEPVDERVVVDATWVFAGGVTAGIDRAREAAADITARREHTARRIADRLGITVETPATAS